MQTSRRTFFRQCAFVSLAFCGAPAWGASPTPGNFTLTVHPHETGLPIARGFLGLSYETGLMTDPAFLSPDNRTLLALLQNLGSEGVIRVGGNSSDFAQWQPDMEALASGNGAVVTPADVQRLAAFVQATGWRLIYGLNLGTGTAVEAADEAAAVAAAAGEALLAFQIGNEPDEFHTHLRPKTYSVQDYLKEWRTFARAVRARVPEAPLAGPDAAWNPVWVKTMAEQDASELVLLSHHYYAEGPASSPSVSIDRMLRSRGRLTETLRATQANARIARLPYRLTEANSCYGGGKYGISDTMASALWGLDFLFQLASQNCTGVNFHGGSGGAYSPVVRNAVGETVPRPLYYGMKLFSQASQGCLVPAELHGLGERVTAYAVRGEKDLKLTVINTDAVQDALIHVDAGRYCLGGTVQRMTAPALSAATGVMLTNDNSETLSLAGQRFSIGVPAASAALITLA